MRRTIIDFWKMIAFISLAIAGLFYGWYSFVGDQISVNATTLSSPSRAASVSRPESLPEPDPNAQTLRAHAARIGLYFGSMEDSMAGNGWGTPWVQKTLGSEFNMMEPGQPAEMVDGSSYPRRV